MESQQWGDWSRSGPAGEQIHCHSVADSTGHVHAHVHSIAQHCSNILLLSPPLLPGSQTAEPKGRAPAGEDGGEGGPNNGGTGAGPQCRV